MFVLKNLFEMSTPRCIFFRSVCRVLLILLSIVNEQLDNWECHKFNDVQYRNLGKLGVVLGYFIFYYNRNIVPISLTSSLSTLLNSSRRIREGWDV